MKFIHDQKLMEKFPNNYTVILRVNGLKNLDGLDLHINSLASAITSKHLSDTIEPICNRWQAIFAMMGAKPKYKSSLKSLSDYFRTNGRLFKIMNIVDLYNYYSLRAAMPMAGYDLDHIKEFVKLSQVPKGLEFTPLGNPKSPQLTKENEIAYVDSEKVICRYWNLQDCDQTKLRNSTENILFFFDLISPSQDETRARAREIEKDFTSFFPDCEITVKVTGPDIAHEVDI